MILASASGSCGAVGAATLRIASDGDIAWRIASYAIYIVVSPVPLCRPGYCHSPVPWLPFAAYLEAYCTSSIE